MCRVRASSLNLSVFSGLFRLLCRAISIKLSISVSICRRCSSQRLECSSEVAFASLRRLSNLDNSGGGVPDSETVYAKLGTGDTLFLVDVVRDLVSNLEGRLDNRPVRVCSSVGSLEVAVMSSVLCTS